MFRIFKKVSTVLQRFIFIVLLKLSQVNYIFFSNDAHTETISLYRNMGWLTYSEKSFIHLT